MTVAEIMSTELVTVESSDSLVAVGRLLLREHVGSAIVVDDVPVGIVTERDFIRAATTSERPLADIDVEQVMSAPLVTIDPGTSVETALRRMREEEIKKLPVREDLELVGIVTLTDVAMHLPEHVADVRNIEDKRGDWTD